MLLKDSINNLNEEGKSLLHLNAKDGNAEFFQNLIEDGADIEMKDRKHGSTPLLYACQNGHIKIVKILLRKGANLIASNFSKKTALHFAAQSGQVDLVDILVKEGLEVDSKDKNDITPLIDACRKGQKDAVEYLLQKGANINATTCSGSTALHFAVQCDQYHIAEMLVKKGLNVNAKNFYGWTPFFQACYEGKKNTVDLFIKNGADLSSRLDKHNCTCLHIASEKGHVEVLRLLLEHGVDLQSRDKSGDTPFLRNCFLGHAKAAKFLLENGANIRDVNNNLLSGLHLIALKDENVYETTKLLLENGADVTLKTNIFYDEMMPFQLAVMRPKPNIPFIKALFDFNPTYDVRDRNNDNAVELVLRKKVHDAMKIVLFSFHQLKC